MTVGQTRQMLRSCREPTLKLARVEKQTEPPRSWKRGALSCYDPDKNVIGLY
jgi:hypothetical protein